MEENNIESFTKVIKVTDVLVQINNTEGLFDDVDKSLNINSEYIEKNLNISNYFENLEYKNTSDFGISIYYYTSRDKMIWEEDNLLPVNIEYNHIKTDKLVGKIFEIQYINNDNPSESPHLNIKIYNQLYLNNKISKIIVLIKQFPDSFNRLRGKYEEIAGSIYSSKTSPKLEEINVLKESISHLSKEHKLSVISGDQKKFTIENIPKYVTIPDLSLTLRDFQDEQNIKSGTAVCKFDPINNTLTLTPGCGIVSGKVSLDRYSNSYSFHFELEKKCEGIIESRIIGHNFLVELLPQRSKKNYSIEIEPDITTNVRKIMHNLDINLASSDYKMKFEGEYYRLKRDKNISRETCKFITQGDIFRNENLIKISVDNVINFEQIKLISENNNEINIDLSDFEIQYIDFMIISMVLHANEISFNIKLYDSGSYAKYKENLSKGKV